MTTDGPHGHHAAPRGRAGEAALIAVNPRASRLRDPRRLAVVLDQARAAVEARTGRAAEVVSDDSVATMHARVAGFVEAGAPLMVAVGGDGTVRDVATWLAGTSIPLAIVPAGTANLFAATVGIPLRPERAAACIAEGRTARIDLGRARWAGTDGEVVERVFVVAVGMGFDARLMAATGHGAKRRLGRYGYFVAALRLLGHVSGASCRLEVDGVEEHLEAIQVLAANGGELVPGLLRPAMRIDPDDGLLDVFVVEGDGLVHGIVGGLEAIARRGTGPSRSGRSRRLRGARVRVSSDPAQPVEVDGDVVGSGWFEAECLPRALRVVVPRHARPPSRGDVVARR